VETIFDTLNAKAALFAIDLLFEEYGKRAGHYGVRHHH
jgi:methionine synthase I (cobalamin-dependent)